MSGLVALLRGTSQQCAVLHWFMAYSVCVCVCVCVCVRERERERESLSPVKSYLQCTTKHFHQFLVLLSSSAFIYYYTNPPLLIMHIHTVLLLLHTHFITLITLCNSFSSHLLHSHLLEL